MTEFLPSANELLRKARPGDPETSHEAAMSNEESHWTHRHRLLITWLYAGPEGLTDEEAAEKAGLLNRTYWKRCGENREPRRAGPEFEARAHGRLIEFSPDGRKRKGNLGSNRKVSVLTRRGYDYIVENDLVPPPMLIPWWGED